MRSFDGRFVLTFNGEIYNHLDLRARLERESAAPPGGWRGTSDTETLLTAVVAWGIERTLKAAHGMFALGLWDSRKRALTLARDRFGEKPLYVARIGTGIAFSSELKALRTLPGFNTSLDPSALGDLLTAGYIRAPATIYQGSCKLLPGTYATITASAARDMPSTGDFLVEALRPYWQLIDQVIEGAASPFTGSEDDAVDELQRHLSAAVRAQQISDVPLGAFLSGGIDSTAVVALMQAGANRKVQTFTIGFEEDSYDESPHAELVAKHLGTEHTTVMMSPNAALERVSLLPTVWDEPFADISQLPSLLLAEVARRSVTVALSGDGGDELFGGYARYEWIRRNWPRISRIPYPVRRTAANVVSLLTPERWSGLLSLLPGRAGRYTGWRLSDAAALIASATVAELYETYMSAWKPGARQLLPQPERRPHWSGYPDLGSPVASAMLYDSVDYMPDDVLVKVDRAAMSVSLETRAPLLDPTIASFAWSLPMSMKQADGQGKRVLRRLVHRYVPAGLVERPKAGFSVPLDDWLRGPMRSWAEDHLTERALSSSGLNPTPIRAAWQAHLVGTANNRQFLWNLLTFQAWKDHHRD